MGKGGAKAGFRVMLKYLEIKKGLDSMLPCVFSVIDHRRRQNVVRTSVTHSAKPRVPLFSSYYILTPSVRKKRFLRGAEEKEACNLSYATYVCPELELRM